jgi:signal transduction histidine kinase
MPDFGMGRGGLGLVSMRERAHLANGELFVDAKPGHGTRIKLALHLPGGIS